MSHDIEKMPISRKMKIWNGLNTGSMSGLSKIEAQIASDILEERRRRNNPYFIPAALNPCFW